jgi:hypothetical protein
MGTTPLATTRVAVATLALVLASTHFYTLSFHLHLVLLKTSRFDLPR